MNGIIFELEEKSKYTGRYMDGEISYNNTSIDYTGLTDEECEEIQRFLEAAEGYPVDVDLETQGFYRCNDAGTLPGECADFIFHKCND